MPTRDTHIMFSDEDPYGSCVAAMKQCLKWAFARDGNMSKKEFENLKQFEEHLRVIDNS